MNKKLKEKVMEALSSVVPITAIVLLLSFTMAPMPVASLILFLVGALLLIVGVGFFSLGVDMAMMPIGDGIGEQVARGSKLWAMVPLCFVIGVFVTIAEPDLQVLAHQVPAVPDMVIILTVAAGVGIFLAVALLRSRFGWPLNKLLIGFYALVFLLAFLVPKEFLAVAFDSGGVTTGPITVPFIMAMGAGLTALRSHKDSEADSFGVVALCSIGPILAVMILGLCYNAPDLSYTPFSIPDLETTADVGAYFASGFPTYIKEVALGLLPIVAFFRSFLSICASGSSSRSSWGCFIHMWDWCFSSRGSTWASCPRGISWARRSPSCPITGSSSPSGWWWVTLLWRRSPPSTC